MDELIDIMRDLLEEVRSMNSKLDDIRGVGINSVDDVCDKLDDVKYELELIKGTGLYDSIVDVCNKIDSLETTITLGDNY